MKRRDFGWIGAYINMFTVIINKAVPFWTFKIYVYIKVLYKFITETLIFILIYNTINHLTALHNCFHVSLLMHTHMCVSVCVCIWINTIFPIGLNLYHFPGLGLQCKSKEDCTLLCSALYQELLSNNATTAIEFVAFKVAKQNIPVSVNL